MKNEVLLSQRVATRLTELPRTDRRRIAEAIEQLSRKETPSISVPLGSGAHGQLFMMRAGNYRLVYRISDGGVQVLDFFVPDELATESDVEFIYEALTEHIPQELDDLSTHTVIDVVEDIRISARVPIEQGYRLLGNGSISVELNYGGGDERDGVTNHASFPFAFELITDSGGAPQELSKVTVDTSSFYE
jgi:mRNA-degrading endonuclease RelE of RelBE toxin-antitoxin system